MSVSPSNLFKRVHLGALSFVLAISSLSALGPILFAQNTSAVTTISSVYDGIPSVQPSSYPSLGYQATSTAEFGDELQLAGTKRHLYSTVVSLTNWACENDYTKLNPTDPCVTTPGSSFSHPITLNLYSVSSGVVGSVIASKTINASVPYRPSADLVNCTDNRWFDGTNCNSGFAFDITFDFSADATMLPNNLVAAIAYNTQSYGVAPIGLAGPYNSLNVSLAGVGPSVGTDVDSDVLFVKSTWPGLYTDGGAGGIGTLRADTNWTGYNLAIRMNATQMAAPTNLTPADNSFTNNNSFDNTWDAVPGAVKYEYTTDYEIGGIPQTYTDTSDAGNYVLGGPTIIRHNSGAPESTYSWKVRAIDVYGNVGEWSAVQNVTVDTTAPTAPLNGQPALTNTNDFYYTWDAATDSASPIVEYQFQASGSNATDVNGSLIGAWQNWVSGGIDQQNLTTPTIHSYGAPDGQYYWQVRAIDAAGNIGAWSTVWDTQIDSTAPSAPVNIGPSNGSTQQGSLTFDWLASTDSAPGVVANYELQYSTSPSQAAGVLNGTVTTVSNILDTERAVSGLADGYIFWQVRAFDAAGNASAWSNIWGYAIDTIAPVVTVSSLITDDSTPELTGTISETAATVTVKVNGSTYNATNNGDGTWTAQVTFGLFDGTYNVKAKAKDLAGNIGTDATTNELLIDAAKPKIKNMSLSDTIINALDVSPILTAKLKGTGTNVADAQYKITNTLGTVVSWTDLLAGDESYDSPTELINSVIDVDALADGTYTLKLRTYDVAGNARTKKLSFLIDRTAPVVAIFSDDASVGNNTPVQITGTITDVHAYTFILTLDGIGVNVPVDFLTHGYTFNTTGLTSGSYVFELTATDAAGNSASDSISIDVDNTAPIITYTGYDQTDAVITPRITIAGQTAFSWIPNGANPSGATYNNALVSPSFTVVATGTYSYAVTAVDEYGNTTSLVFAFNYTAPIPVAPSTFTDVAVGQVLGEQTDQATTPDAASTSTDTAVAGAKDTSGDPLKIFGIAWYWILAIIVALLALWALLAALLRRRQQNS